ncbi:MAG TPA: sulfite exporter TauE/SafE family protein, partial [Pseudolabrys sp.]|nr:sulfite exporter TauE/SafE family protein [Pseudolabrys sp.]
LGIAIGAQLGLLFPAKKLIFLLSFLIIVVAGWIGYLSTQSGDAGKARNASSAPVGIRKRQVVRIVPTAFVVGIISGFFAIGGGFLVVPGLALAAAIDLRLSARCSLIPITAFAALDALEYVQAGNVQFGMSGIMIVAGIVGGAGGLVLGDRLPLPVVQRTFAVFLGVIAAYMVAQNI